MCWIASPFFSIPRQGLKKCLTRNGRVSVASATIKPSLTHAMCLAFPLLASRSSLVTSGSQADDSSDMVSRWRQELKPPTDALISYTFTDFPLPWHLRPSTLRCVICTPSCRRSEVLLKARDHLPRTVKHRSNTYDPSLLIHLSATYCLDASSPNRLTPLYLILVALFGELLCTATFRLQYATIPMRHGHCFHDTLRALCSCAILQGKLIGEA